ncbi:MAG TPA: hypothetical protein VNA24_36775 [Hyalangium sp.]|nr:hypothetical protein [Hyalangium sp.]
MRFIRGGKIAALAVFMISLAQAACGPMPEEAMGNEVQAQASSAQLVLSEPSQAGSKFDVALTANNKQLTAHVEASPEALKALGAADDAQLTRFFQERLQRDIDAGKVQVPEGVEPRIVVKASPKFESSSEKPSEAFSCTIAGIISVEYDWVFPSPTCTYIHVMELWNGLYNQCDGSLIFVSYITTYYYGPYSCG